VHVLQGEREMAQDNRTLGKFIFDGIPPAPRGTPQIEVTFDIDANGILNVSAKDKATGKEQCIRIEASSDLTREEIERMKQEAQAHMEEDKKKKEIAEARNTADALIYTAEKSLSDAKDTISEETKKTVEEKIEQLKKIKDSDDIPAIKTRTSQLSAELQKIGSELYKQSPSSSEEKPKGEEEKKDKDNEQE
jgi:molecular chaperone DnaK